MQTLGEDANKVVGYRSTMRICGGFEDLGDLEERPQAHRMAREGVVTALLAVDHADRRLHAEAHLAER